MDKPKTDSQRNSLHKWCELVAGYLNGHGMLLEYKVLTKTVRKRWTKELVKELIYKPILKALTDKQSTEDMNTIEPGEVYLTICSHFASEAGLTLPAWPDRYTMQD